MRGVWQEVLERVGVGVLLVGALALVLLVTFLVPEQPELALGLAAVALIGVVALAQPVTLPLMVMGLVVVVRRTEIGGLDMSLADWSLAVAFWPAVLLAPRPFSAPMRQLIWLTVCYQSLTLFTVIANPFAANSTEWFHAWLITGGAIVVGWAVGASGHGRVGVSLFLISCLFLAGFTIVEGAKQWITGNFAPLYPSLPFTMHKNFMGTLMGFAAVVAYAHPRWVGWSRQFAFLAFWVFAGALAFTQSRQALLGLAAGVLLLSLRRDDTGRRRSLVILFSVIPILAAVATAVRDQIASGNEHNSFFQRLEWYDQTMELISQQPLVGHGLRYWVSGRTPYPFQPPQVFLEQWASSGVLGLVGLLIVLVGGVLVVRRLPREFGALALALLVSRVVQGQVDIYWVSPTTAVPNLLVGVCVGAAFWQQSRATGSEVGDPVVRPVIGAR